MPLPAAPPVFISETTRQLVHDFCIGVMERLGNPPHDLEVNINSVLDVAQRWRLLLEMQHHLNQALAPLDILEIGAGIGMFTVVGQLSHLTITGTEPAANSYSTSARARRQLLQDNQLPPQTILEAPGEALPFEAERFDLAVSFNVLEHVAVPQQVLNETYRVLKPGGRCYFKMPNYTTFYEGHYGLFWLPFLDKTWAKPYVRLWGRNPAFLQELFFVRPAWVKRWAETAGFEQVRVFADPVDPGAETSSTARAPWVMRSLWQVSQSRSVARLLQTLRIYPMITLIGRKPAR